MSCLAVASIMPFSITGGTVAPNAVNPFRCWSIGRTPKLQPPGMETRAIPNRPSRDPRK